MSVSPLASNPLLDPSTATGPNAHRKDLKALADALQSGDLSAAQKAFAQLLKDSPRLAQAVNETPTASSNPRVADFQALANALKSGDLSSSQQAMAKLLQDSPRAHQHPSLANASGLLPLIGSADDTSASGETVEDTTVGTMLNAVA
jgi:DNA-binding FadR family transcriptional regulator